MAQQIVLLVIWAGFAVAGWKLGRPHGRQVPGAMLGFLLGLIGLGILALLNWRRPRNRPVPPTETAAEDRDSTPVS